MAVASCIIYRGCLSIAIATTSTADLINRDVSICYPCGVPSITGYYIQTIITIYTRPAQAYTQSSTTAAAGYCN